MPRLCVRCLKPELFITHPANGHVISNLRPGPQGPVCGYCWFEPEITLARRLELSVEMAMTIRRIQEAHK